MPLTDMPLEDLRDYRPDVAAPDDFEEFWTGTLAAARAADGAPAVFLPVTDTPLVTVDVYDVRFPGWGGHPIAGWLVLPRGATQPLPAVITYLGYSCGRGLPHEHLLWASAGYAHFVVDTRAQGHDTPDPDGRPTSQWVEGLMTQGIESPGDHYYRRVMADCVRAVDVLREHPAVDASRIVVSGGSQGGGLALATAGLVGDAVAGALIDVPFLCHYRRGADTASDGPYVELVRYLGWHKRDDPDRLFRTLNYFDGQHFAARASAPALFSVALMDPVCPPSTVYAAYNRYAGEKAITVWQFGDHSGGRASQAREQLDWLAARGLRGHAGA
ncbi:acetylxylan esterase [Streptomyces sp. RFCAC02]|uniref:acetylxylan esterase n=1 Tax=Streptomyces sp. RFCAC02 TaxID=2499143 RepID=UPI0010228FF9|nr:acetylxylan esterase [Streptomyces sp. RFCAC02]